MSSNHSISINNISKSYKIYKQPRDRLLQSIFGTKKTFYDEFWALKDINFDIKKGACIGIIGRNGSGKSTLLQIIAGTLTPTSGAIDINGRVSALLELGSGFNPEFTGRENVIMNGIIMGLSKEEIIKRLPDIESFAEIGYFIDQPVKTYSSGMFVRLAFACAVHVDPEILIVDEALAVGDMYFQLKCIEKMKSFKKEGKTILFVSHDSFTVRNFCDEAIWMMDGLIHLRGDVKTVTEQYQDFMKYGMESRNADSNQSDVSKKNDILEVNKVTFKNTQGQTTTSFQFGEEVIVEVNYTLKTQMHGLVGGVALYDKQNTYIIGLNTKLDEIVLSEVPGNYQLTLSYRQMQLMPGTFYVDIGFFESSAIVILDYKSRFASFQIHSGDYFAEGLTFINHVWACKELDQKNVKVSS